MRIGGKEREMIVDKVGEERVITSKSPVGERRGRDERRGRERERENEY